MSKNFIAFCLGGFVLAGCTMEAGSTGDTGIDPRDVKPEDGSELAGANLGSAAQPHALHYTDPTNQWMETGYPMGTDNPNCKDWWIYDRYLSTRPAIGTTKYDTFYTSHPWAQGTYINNMIAAIPESLGYTAAMKASLVDHNTVVARTSGRCSGRYVFQWDNRSSGGPYEATQYWASADLTSKFVAQNKAACLSTKGESIPALMVDLYVCEAPTSAGIGTISSWCGVSAGHWRKVGSSTTSGYWTESLKSCSVATGVFYPTPVGKVAVSFNMVIKAGVGHAPAPADIWIIRYN